MFMGSNDWYHNLASPYSVKQNRWTWVFSTKWYAFIQSFVHSEWGSASSSGFPENSGLKWHQLKCAICCWCGGCPCSTCCACCSCCCGGGCPALSWGVGVGVLEHLALVVLALPYLTCFYLVLVALCLYSNLLCSRV